MYDEAREDVANEEEYLDVDFASDEYLGREPITRMVVFCRWDSDRWGWDPDEPRGGGEYAIRNWPRNGSAEIEAESFPEFLIDKLLHGGLGSWAGGDRPGFAPATARKEKSPKQRPAKPEAAKPKAGAKPKRRSAQEENKHLHKIVADPTDKAAQRAYARWLDKYGDPVGELIRVRLELATLAASDPQRAALARREKTLTARVVKKNNQELLAHGLVPWALHRLGARVRQNDEGEIRYIELEGDQINAGVLREFAAYPVLRDLELNSHPLTAEELDLIGRLAPLRELHLHDVGLGDKGFEPISRLADLEYLCLADPKTKGPGLARLAGLTKLELLHLQGLTSSRIKGHLAALESWPALRKLFLGGNKLRGEALAGLARLPRVEMLGLDENPIRDDDLAHLAELTNLKWLDLTETKITGAGLKHLQKLRRLEVLKTKELPDAEAAAPWLARLTSLRELDLEGPWVKGGSLTDAGAAHLAGLNHLTRLNLKRQRLTDAALAHFAGLQDLEELNLEHNEEIVGPGLEHLKRLPKLKRLILDSTGISNDSVPLLKTFTRLESLDVFGTKIDERGKNTLRKALPKTSI